ncbi:MAG: serine hydrolase [Alphaproteobacteria bacterium]|nr:serine hydrolase [Alphaproteobacteria bacterium]
MSMRLFGQIALGLVLLILAGVNLVYWQDPWLWRGYVRMVLPPDHRAEGFVVPDEEIRGDNSFQIPVAAPESRTISDSALAAVDAFADRFESYALIVVHKGEVQHEWYAADWTRDKLTQSQSMHKTLQAVLIGIAIADGKIRSADEPVGNYIDEWRGDPRGAISLRQLMMMSSGLERPGFTLDPFSRGMQWLFSGDSTRIILDTPMAGWAPGSRWEYNDLNSEILGMVLSRVYDARYAEILRDKVWLPMGGARARVHVDEPGGRAYTSCCLGAPAMDWARIGLMLLGRGRVNGRQIVSSDWIKEMTTPSPVARHYGLQTWLGYDDPPIPNQGAGSTDAIASGPFLARDTFMTWGRGQQHVFVVPSQDLVVVRLGPWTGRNPIKPGFDVTFFVNTIMSGFKP